jgi:hypothetical protein
LPSFFSPYVSANSHICVMTPANNKFTCMVRKWFPSKQKYQIDSSVLLKIKL